MVHNLMFTSGIIFPRFFGCCLKERIVSKINNVEMKALTAAACFCHNKAKQINHGLCYQLLSGVQRNQRGREFDKDISRSLKRIIDLEKHVDR
jgi:hypothetical protein